MYGKKLRQLRHLEGWTTEEVAKKIGVAKQTYNHYENEKRKPGLTTIRKLAEVYGVDLDQIFGEELIKEEEATYKVNGNIPIIGDIAAGTPDRKSTRLNSSHVAIS